MQQNHRMRWTWETGTHTFPIVHKFTSYGKIMGKHKYSKGLGFLHVPHSSISREIETCTIPITWEHWILIVRETYGKTQTFQSYGLLTYFMCGINTYNSQNMRKVNSQSKEKIWENTSISKLSVSEIFCLKQKSMQFPKHGKTGFPLYGKSMGKHKHFKFMVFLNISDEAEIHTIPKTWEKWIPIIREKYGKKANIP